jgi:hypothetical protein
MANVQFDAVRNQALETRSGRLLTGVLPNPLIRS